MQKNWYVVYTKPKFEKRVTAFLNKKKIEYFFPEKIRKTTSLESFRRKKDQTFIFNSYVFIHIDDSLAQKIKSTEGCISFLYWKNELAKIQEDEIETIKEFVADYHNIKIEKSFVNLNDKIKIIDGPQYSMDGNLLSVKNSVIKINLPSLGFILTAELASENTLSRKLTFGNKELFLQS